jgi:hypothetical protein
MPAGAEIVLADPLAAAPEYSVFGVRGFRLVNDAPIPELAGRPDLSVRYARTAADLPDPGPSRVYLTLDARGRPIEARGDSLVGARRRLAPAGALLPGL